MCGLEFENIRDMKYVALSLQLVLKLKFIDLLDILNIYTAVKIVYSKNIFIFSKENQAKIKDRRVGHKWDGVNSRECIPKFLLKHQKLFILNSLMSGCRK